MNISPDLLLGIGIGAGVMFVGVFVVSAIITNRNRRILQKAASRVALKVEKSEK